MTRFGSDWRHRICAALVAVVALAGCTDDGGGDSSSTTTVPEADTVLQVASIPWPSCLNPVTCRDDAARALVWEHVLPRLMVVDHAGAYQPSPVLAGAPEVEPRPDGTSRVTFRFRDEARWSDGRPMTSTDVVASWMAWRDTPTADRTHVGHVVSVDDRDPRVAIVTLDQPYADWPELFGGFDGWLLQADALGPDTDVTGQWERELPFGAGSFELVRMGADRIDLVAREDGESGREPQVDLVEIDRVEAGPDPDWPAEATVLIPGSDAAASGEASPGYVPVTTPSDRVVGVMLDQRTSTLADPFVRVAVNRLVDRAALAQVTVAAGSPEATVVRCAGWLPQQRRCAAVARDAGPVDRLGAVAALEEGRWILGSDGARARGREPLAFPVGAEIGRGREGAVASALRSAFRSVGIVGAEADLPASWADPARADATGVGVVAVELGTVHRLRALYGCSEFGRNPLGWCDPEVQGWLAQLTSATGDDAGDEISAAILTRAADQLVWLPLAAVPDIALVATGSVVPDRRSVGGGPLAGLVGWVPPER